MANYLKIVLLDNDLVGCKYIELYAGGAAVALSLLFEEYVESIQINDLDRGVYSFWKMVIEEPEALCRRINDEPVTMAQWRKQREVQDSDAPDALDLAFSTFFLNRTNRSGIIHGGVIGGQKQEGKWKLDARYNKQELILRIEKIARYASRILVTGRDAAAALQDVRPGRSTLLYLDPPYFVKGAGLYLNHYEEEDHRRISRLVAQLQCPWIVSYDAVEEIERLYEGFCGIRYGLSYSAAARYKGGEVMFFSPLVGIPPMESPTGIHRTAVERMMEAVYRTRTGVTS